MVRIALAFALVASVLSNRIQQHSDHTTAKFGASCENLHVMFHSRVVEMQSLIDAHPDASQFSAATSARFMMRSYGIVRTMRRARTCSWLVDGDSDDIAQTRAIVRTLLVGNPCAQAAKDELQVGRDAETAEVEMQSIYRAMLVLRSDNCEVASDHEFTMVEDEAELEALVQEEDAVAQDNVDIVMDAVESETGSAFVETEAVVSVRTSTSIMRTLGTVFAAIFLALSCVGFVAFITGIIGLLLGFLLAGNFIPCDISTCGIVPVMTFLMGGVGGGLLGIGPCSYALYAGLLD